MSDRRAGIGFKLENARLDYAGERLFDDLSLRVAAGEWLAIVGESGVGKSSLLRLIAGLDCGAAASARVGVENDGEAVAERVSAGCGGNRGSAGDDANQLRRRLAWMAQDDMLLPWLTVLDNVCVGERLRGARVAAGQRERALELLRRVGLSAVAAARPDQLSGGMRQRVALARTLYESRPLVLMDEPFSALDAITRLQLQELAAELLDGRTVLLITHDPLEALRLGDRVLVLAGRPAQFSELEMPRGARPRDLTDPQLLAKQGELLDRLAHHRLAADSPPRRLRGAG